MKAIRPHPQRWRRSAGALGLGAALTACLLASGLLAGGPPGAGGPKAPVERGPAAPAAAPGFQAAVTSDAASPIDPRIPRGFVSLSVEAADFTHGFTADTPGLVTLLRGLHPGFLRVGADTGDYGRLPDSTLAKIAELSKATGVPVVLELAIRGHQMAQAVTQAVVASRLIGPALIGLEIGNESDAYGRSHYRQFPWNYPDYVKERDRVLAKVRAAHVTTPIWGPDDSAPAWLRFAALEPHSPYQVLNPHFYPLTSCGGPQPSIKDLLSDGSHREEQQEASLFADAHRESGLPVIGGETNSVACGGQPGVSNTLASTLWAVDYGLTMARAGVTALAFHIPESGCRGYSPICLVSRGANAHWRGTPEYAGLRLLANLEGSQLHTTHLASHRDHVRAYGVTRPDGSSEIIILDLDSEGHQPLRITWYPQTSPVRTGGRIAAQALGGGKYDSPTVRPPSLLPTTVTYGPSAVRVNVSPATITTLIQSAAGHA